MIQGLWDRKVEAIINVKLGNSDMDSYKYEPMAALLDRWETIKKDKHGKHCINQRKHFSPFVVSVDRMLGREALAVLAQLSQTMAEKRDEPHSARMGVNKRSNFNRGREILLTYYPRSSTPQSGSLSRRGLGSRAPRIIRE